MHPQVEITAFEMVFPPPGAELEQEERMGPGYGSSCDQDWRVVRGKLVRLMNPRGHFNFLAPDGACGDPDDSSAPGGRNPGIGILGSKIHLTGLQVGLLGLYVC